MRWLLIAGASTLAGCGTLGGVIGPSSPRSAKVDWDWERPEFATEAGTDKTVFLEWIDHEVVKEISNPTSSSSFKQDIARILKEKYGLKVTEKSEEADYFVQLHLRYFNGNDKADRGDAVRAAAGKIGGGRTGWFVPGEGPLATGIPVPPIPDLSKAAGKEWVLLIDVAVGEKGGDPTAPDRMTLRRGRLLGYLPCGRLSQDDILWYFKYGKAYPRPPEPVDGVIPASYVKPDPASPAEEILNVLIPGILPLVN